MENKSSDYNDCWEEFLEKLDNRLKGYLNAIKYVSEIKADNIDNEKIREEINENLKVIVEFIKDYSSTHYEIGLIKGFKVNEKDINGNWKIDGRDYYYYIADQKMKASVYYIRYLNYINQHFNGSEKEERYIEEIKEYISQKSKDVENVNISIDNIISIIDDYLEVTDENNEINEMRQKCIECIEKIRAKDINYIKYMLFNNMMREIRYIGAAYQYLWHWDMKTKNLFRSVSYESSEIEQDEKNKDNKKYFLQNMFGNVISHMNNSSKKLCSYSEEPYIDIFKYLKITKDNSEQYIDIFEDSNIKIKIENLENKNKATFDIIKGVKINSIYINNEAKSFYDFVQSEEAVPTAYAVELYPLLKEEEKNEKGTTKNIKKLLYSYLNTWCNNEKEVEKLMSYVADDKEVVTDGIIEKGEVVNVTADIDNINLDDNLADETRYRMELDKNEFIYLLLKIRKDIDITKISKKISEKVNWDNFNNYYNYYSYHNFDEKFSNFIKNVKNENTEKLLINYVIDINNVYINIKCEILPSFITNTINGGDPQNKKEPTLEDYKKKITDYVKEKITEYFEGRYTDICEESHKIADFILKFINEENHKCPSYINKYNEYEPDKGDKEISILKYLIFKE